MRHSLFAVDIKTLKTIKNYGISFYLRHLPDVGYPLDAVADHKHCKYCFKDEQQAWLNKTLKAKLCKKFKH